MLESEDHISYYKARSIIERLISTTSHKDSSSNNSFIIGILQRTCNPMPPVSTELCNYLSSIGKPFGIVEINPYKRKLEVDIIADADHPALKDRVYYDAQLSRSHESISFLERVYPNLLLFHENQEWNELCDYTIDQKYLHSHSKSDLDIILSEIESVYKTQENTNIAAKRRMKEFEALIVRNVTNRIKLNTFGNQSIEDAANNEGNEFLRTLKDTKDDLLNLKLTPFQASNNLVNLIFSENL